MNATKIENLARAIYIRVYHDMNDVSDTTHYTTKMAEIVEWLTEGDLTGATVESLAADWVEFDQDEEACDD
jgi:hypothetical protein